jgi:RNA polymerase sigma-70 factor (ECF subfamily)
MSIAKNSVIDHYRKIKLKTISINSMIDETGRELFQPSTNDSPLSEMLNSEYKKLLNDVIIKLPKIYKRMANLYYNIDMSYDEISERLKCPLGTVKGTLFRARKEMRKSLPALA